MTATMKDWTTAGFATGLPAVSVLADLNVYLAFISFGIGIAVGLLRLRAHFKNKK